VAQTEEEDIDCRLKELSIERIDTIPYRLYAMLLLE
jgi:hypothetical protein